MKHDVVYLLKNNYSESELLYSLRSVCLNFPFRKIVTVGGCPEYVFPDIKIEHVQEGSTKWERSRSSLIKALECEELTEDIWLFNDDFFVMDKMKANEDVNYFRGSLEKTIIDIKRAKPQGSNYINQLERARGQLLNMGKDALSFALHVPMLINREKALALIRNKNINSIMFRSIYGNYYEIPCRYMKDVKVFDLDSVPDTSFISTTDLTFRDGKVGEFLRKYFNKPCEYEKSQADRLRDNTRERFDEEGEIRYEITEPSL